RARRATSPSTRRRSRCSVTSTRGGLFAPGTSYLELVAPFAIRTFGDPVLKQRCTEVTEIDDALRSLVEGMLQTMYEAPGVGLAANQVGVQKRLFVYDVGEGPGVVVNPVLSDHRDEWVHHEGCLSVPDLWWDIGRAKEVRLTGLDLDGNALDIE